jgi:luciferase family oxidoreductase group 1
MAMVSLSVLDLVPVAEGSDLATAFNRSVDLARHCEQSGYRRFWIAEHHGMSGIASAATSVVIAHIGAHTASIRIGAGGIMLPNHAPLAIAEQFGTLDALYPGRIDLGLGRAPGSDMAATRALRRTLGSDSDRFPADVVELLRYFAGIAVDGVVATPGAGANVEPWILGSSLYGAQLAAVLGLPYAFASHFAPDALDDAIAIYRREFRPSDRLQRPYVMAGFNVFAAATTAEARFLASSMEQSFVAIRTGRPIQLPPPRAGYRDSLPPAARAMLDNVLQSSAIGDEAHVAERMAAFASRTGADELIIAGQMFDHGKRLESYAIAARAARTLGWDMQPA